MRTQARMRTVGLALTVLAALALGEAHAGGFSGIDAAWKEAIILAGIPSSSLIRPLVSSGESTSAWRNSPTPLPHYVMVEEFLGSIYDQISAAPKLAALACAQASSREDWVREKMGWRIKSRAYSEPAVVRLASAAAGSQIH